MKHMKKAKLLGAVLALLAAGALIVSGTYAWLTISKSPAAEGIQIMVSGGSAIYMAPDITDKNGNHYPGEFSDKLQLAWGDGSGYVAALTPVSTADGLNWFLPAYYAPDDPEVQGFEAAIGQRKPIAEFENDSTLRYANLGKEEKTEKGSYLYVDFWVVSLNSNFDLHVSRSDELGVGSYAIGLQEVVKNEDGSYSLKTGEGSSAECLRIGFLINQNDAKAADAAAYARSDNYVDRYKNLRGSYQEKGESITAAQNLNSFTVYEPNADLHTAFPELNGKYIRTDAVGLVDGKVQLVDMAGRLCTQLASAWTDADNVFQAAVREAKSKGVKLTESNLRDYFYKVYLQNQTSPYVEKGNFIKNTVDLYLQFAVEKGMIVTDVSDIDEDNASTTKLVTLDKNTPQRIRMFVWLEGQDVDCTNGADANQLALSIELAGGSVQ